jgi:hypothetical protein
VGRAHKSVALSELSGATMPSGYEKGHGNPAHPLPAWAGKVGDKVAFKKYGKEGTATVLSGSFAGDPEVALIHTDNGEILGLDKGDLTGKPAAKAEAPAGSGGWWEPTNEHKAALNKLSPTEAQEKADKHLASHGWESVGATNGGGIFYQHGDHPGHRIFVDEGGGFIHRKNVTANNPTGQIVEDDSGITSVGLANHLGTFHGKPISAEPATRRLRQTA